MRQALVAGNWKMNGTSAANQELVAEILAGVGSLKTVEVAICPPSVYIASVAQQIAGSSVVLGAQTLSEYEQGAYTGEIAGDMLKELGCHYVLVGHSERRSIYAESSQQVADKFAMAQKQGLVPVLCVGETLEQREAGETESVIAEQLQAVLDTCGIAAFGNAVVAYEPVWAIGTGKTATPEQAQEVHAFIRQMLAGQDAEVAAGLRILYGGSVKPANAGELFNMTDIDGGLIGGAALQADDFLSICQQAE